MSIAETYYLVCFVEDDKISAVFQTPVHHNLRMKAQGTKKRTWQTLTSITNVESIWALWHVDKKFYEAVTVESSGEDSLRKMINDPLSSDAHIA